ncbi:deaminase [Rheinheimera sp. NSM]|uniref:deaminase n=1 Tax=Rheinheimera sp. NSM TaxID=3457884 RepID=UPI0040369FC0
MVDNQYSELVFGLTAPIGVDCSAIIQQLELQIAAHNWSPHLVNTSSLVLNESRFSCSREQETGLTAFRISAKQGEYLKEYGEKNYLTSLNAAITIWHIKNRRDEQQEKCREDGTFGVVYIVNMLLDDKDSEQLREFYSNAYYQIGITDSEENRRKNLDQLFRSEDFNTTQEQNFAREAAQRIDKNEIEKVFVNSDFFINASITGTNTIDRFVDLVFGAPNVSPTHSEYSMFMAFMASVNSADLSRQVGAVISSKHQDIIATGSNDVQKSGGGKYWPDEVYKPLLEEHFNTYEDKRDASNGYDANAETILQLSSEIADALITFMPELSGIDENELAKTLRKKTGLKDITEFGRVVHAELSAIMSASRNGISVVGGHLFCTTFPCHNCAKHIIASGIERVEYIEPYPKSKAMHLHQDSISMKEESSGKVVFSAFTGVGPRRFLDLFSTMGLGAAKKIERKTDEGKAIPTKRGSYNHPRIPTSLASQIFKEDSVEILTATALAEKITRRPESIFDKTYTSYIKVFKDDNSLNMIERVGDLAASYPYDYGFSMQVVDKIIAPKLFKGLYVNFKLKVGDTRLLLANSIVPADVNVESDGGEIFGKCVGTANRSKEGNKWYITRLVKDHPSDYLVKESESLSTLSHEISSVKVSFTLIRNSRGYYEARNVQPLKGRVIN